MVRSVRIAIPRLGVLEGGSMCKAQFDHQALLERVESPFDTSFGLG